MKLTSKAGVVKPNRVRGASQPNARRHENAGRSEGIVAHIIMSGESHSQRIPSAELVKKLLAGLPVREFDDLQAGLDVPRDRLGALLGISKATLYRRRTAKKPVLMPDESDRVIRFAQLMKAAIQVLGSKEQAREWLNSPQPGLGGAVPMEYAQTEVGAREVEDLLGRIEYSVYS